MINQEIGSDNNEYKKILPPKTGEILKLLMAVHRYYQSLNFRVFRKMIKIMQ